MALESRFRRTWFKLGSRTLQLAGAGGIIAIVVGAAIGAANTAGIILIGIGSSVIASVLVGGIALGRDEFLQQLLGDGVQDVFDDRNAHFEDTFWDDLIGSSRKHFRVLGTANHGYISDPAVATATKEAVLNAIKDRDVEVEFLWLDPEHDLAKAREREERRSTRKDTCSAILFFWDLRSSLPATKQHKLVLKEYRATPSCGVIWRDDLLIVTQYLAGNPNLHAPGLVLGRSQSYLDRPLELLRLRRAEFPPITRRFIGNFEAIRQGASEIGPTRIEDLRAKLAQYEREAEQAGFKSEAELRTEGS